jgi:GDPmannose 4,6-dehydratase
MRSLILGVTGQDGQFLSNHLLRKGNSVLGISRNSPNWKFNPLGLLRPDHSALDVFNYKELYGVIDGFKPDEIYNLSGESSVAKSFSNSEATVESNTVGALNLLNSVVALKRERKIRIFQASSCEMFGFSEDQLNEKSTFSPISPYGVSKLTTHKICQKYREQFELWIACGILFNHESELRTSQFVFQKVIKSLVAIKKGAEEYLKLGNIDVSRDWGYAPDYVDAIHRCLQFDHPTDFVIASGKLNSLEDLIKITCGYLLIREPIDSLVRIDLGLKRVVDINRSFGNPQKAQNLLGWKATTTFEEMVAKLVEYNLSKFN